MNDERKPAKMAMSNYVDLIYSVWKDEQEKNGYGEFDPEDVEILWAEIVRLREELKKLVEMSWYVGFHHPYFPAGTYVRLNHDEYMELCERAGFIKEQVEE
ncbi:MAG: hypothetical protein LC793_16245 [Thermomicrobia bacterium]|nr:hypothetical protein [Thermomicrobia bacterium]MCA1723033.1 hypothetical protein [Thermomicrobia bacterium]